MAAVRQQLAVYKKACAGETTDKTLPSAFEELEGVFFNNMALVLDRYYVHRLRMVTGRHCNPLNEVELICDSLMNNNGIFRGNNVVNYVPDQSVVKLNIGDKIRLMAGKFESLSTAFFAELVSKFITLH